MAFARVPPQSVAATSLPPGAPKAASACLPEPGRSGVPPVETLRFRRDFLAANAGRRWHTPGFMLLALSRNDGDDPARVGITVTRKIGGAVVRNRLKRRLRSVIRAVVPQHGQASTDYVLIGRSDGLNRPMSEMVQDLTRGLQKVGKDKRPEPKA